ncbi:CAP-Gly domain protein [Rhizobium sp. CFBP 8762]|uniref:CAP-Gly domain protein n=1 Tax=Rhizobium sp. CFBP 8762 TaxID=2775279 RepID=UPI0017842C4F|nr:CAP-Gly domain protein [Rhizobium sp. CFBP 8762]MBD8555363.1 CAP-Gly domain protein [Rhizobium sp. CFBP 8762]
MNEFYVGQKVVCIDAKYTKQQRVSLAIELVEGQIYTIRWLGPFTHYLDGEFIGIKVAEIHRGADKEYGYDDMPYRATRFRPLVEDRLASLRNLTAPQPDGSQPYQPDAPEEPKRRVKEKEDQKV